MTRRWVQLVCTTFSPSAYNHLGMVKNMLTVLDTDWDTPYAFFAPGYHLRTDDGYEHYFDGSVGRLIGMW